MTGLPELPQGQIRSVKLFRRMLLAFLVREADTLGNIQWSQRDIAAFFNRDGEFHIGTHLNFLCRDGYLVKVRKSTGALPDTYGLGRRPVEADSEYNYYSRLAEALYSDSGLVTIVGRNEILGSGCLNASGAVVLGALVSKSERMDVCDLKRYLTGLVSSRTISSVLSRLKGLGIVKNRPKSVELTHLWREHLDVFLTSREACCPRQSRGDRRRKAEQAKNLARLNRGLLTGAERTFLKQQKCVYCDADGIQQQHFPPRRFLDDYIVINNKHFIWPICRSCNDAEKNFIRAMPALPSLELLSIRSSDSQQSDLLMLYRDVSEQGIKNFHRAHQSGDLATAHWEVVKTHVLWMCLELRGATDESDRYDSDSAVAAEDTLRVPLRRKRHFSDNGEARVKTWLTAVVSLDDEVFEFSFRESLGYSWSNS